MAQATIDLTERQEYFLKEFAAKHYPGSRDNVGTDRPIHLVQTRRERVVDPDYDSADKITYFVPDWEEVYDSYQELIAAYYKDKECPIPIVSFDEAYRANDFIDVNGEAQVIFGEEEYLEAYGIKRDFYCKTFIGYYFETVAYFWTLDEAKRYMEYQGHNLTNPRTYTVSGGYANKGEYYDFWELLFNLGCQLNKES